MMPFSKSHPASSETRVPPSTLIHRSTLLIGSQPSCPVTTSGIRTILGAHKTDIKLTRRGWSCRVSFCDHPMFPDEVTSQFFGRSMSVGYHLILFCEQGGQEPKRAGFAAISMGQPPAREREHFDQLCLSAQNQK